MVLDRTETRAQTTDEELWQLKTDSLRQNSVRNVSPNSHNVTAATTHVYKQIDQNTTWNDTEYTRPV